MDNLKLATHELRPACLDLILYPTEQCNFRCTYCYEDFSIGRMSPSTVQSVKELIARRISGVNEINLKWFGGEPLAARDIIVDISQHALACADVHAVRVRGDLTTNGYLLTPAVASELVALKQDIFQVSLDGIRDVHDKTRPLLSGGGTFVRIWKNLIDLSKTSLLFNIVLRLHLTKSNLDSIKVLLGEIAGAFSNDHRFSIFFKPVEQLSTQPIIGTEVLAKESWAGIVEDMSRCADRLGLRTVPEDRVCYAARPNSVAIRATGKIQKCTVLLDNPANDVGHLLADGTLQLDTPKLLPWVEVLLQGDEGAIACPASSVMRKHRSHRVIQIATQ